MKFLRNATLVTGVSGSGKTSFVQTIITLVASRYSPNEANFIVFDSKLVDYGANESMPHMIAPVISDVDLIEKILSYLDKERERRKQMLVSAGHKSITSYNKDGNQSTIPHIFFVLDDFSSLWLSSPDTKLFEGLLKILRDGRAAGIHLVCVTSLLPTKGLPKEILSYIPCRISFRVLSLADSGIAIGRAGAETLAVPGELIYSWQNTLVRCQGIYVPYEEICVAIEAMQKREFHKINVISESEDSAYDELLLAAASIILDTQRASEPMLQRQLKVPYERAISILDQLEKLGLVSQYSFGSRMILMTGDKWNRICKAKGLVRIQTPQKSATQNNVSTTDAEENNSVQREPPDIPMRSFPKTYIGDNALLIEDNQIKLDIKVQTKLGKGTTWPQFNGKIVAELIYKKSGRSAPGCIQFKVKPNILITNNNPELLDITKENAENFLKIEFTNADERVVKNFVEQISEDIGIPVTELETELANDDNLPDLQGDYAKAVFLWAYSKTAKIRNDDEYARYLAYECGVRHPSEYHKQLVYEGYLGEDSIETELNSLTVVELKTMAKDLGVLRSGKKADIISRILANADATYISQHCPATFSLSEKGKNFLDDHFAYVQLHRNRVWNIDWREYDLNHRPGESFEDTVIRILETRASKDTRLLGRLEYYYLYQVYLKLDDRVHALEYLLKVLCFDVSGSHGIFDFRGCRDKQELKDSFRFHITPAPGIIDRIADLRDVYSSEIAERVYDCKLPVQICNKELFLDMVNSIVSGVYDMEDATNQLERAYYDYIDGLQEPLG